MRLVLVRHGRTSSNTGFKLDTAAPGADLDQTGRAQADALVQRLAEQDLAAVFASNLVRTQQTAAPLAAARSLPVQVLANLREISAGEDEMSTDATRYISTMIRWGQGEPEARIPGGETGVEFMNRFELAIETITGLVTQPTMVVSHGAALRVWSMARVDGFADALGRDHLDNTAVITVEGSFERGWELVSLDGVLSYSGTHFDASRFEPDA